MDLDKTIVAQRRTVSGGDMTHYMVGIEGPMEGERIEIGKAPMIIGRRQDATVRIEEPTVSGHHCRIVVIMGQVMIEDLGSSNGTFVNEERIEEPKVLTTGAVIQIGDSLFTLEHRSKKEVEEEERQAGDLAKAANYVRTLLPMAIPDGEVTTEWRFIPSDQLGGDCFGYHWLDADHFAVYLVDVSGHGTAPALHSVSVMNLLKKQSLPSVDFGDPAAVMTALNESFLMEDHGNLYFTLWYGVFEKSTQQLTYASAGHPPALLLSASEPQELFTPNMAVGMMSGIQYKSATVDVGTGSRLFVYSDGAYEVVTQDGEEWRVQDFLELLAGAPNNGQEPKWVEDEVRSVMKDDIFDDDFSILVVRFG
jgi:sigma-B regulation protein RsbU (phosphoserine phosphatase)